MEMGLLTATILTVVVLQTLCVGYGMKHAEGQLTCNETTIMLRFNKTELNSRGPTYTIAFKHDLCKVDNRNSTENMEGDYIWIASDYNMCGVDVFEEEDAIVYNQTVIITYGKNPENQNLVFREEYDEYSIQCRKMRNFTESLENDFVNVTAKETRKFAEVGNTTFDVDLERFDKMFTTEDNSGTAMLGDILYFQLELESKRNDIELNPQDCYATKNDGSGRYYFIQNKCPHVDDSTVVVRSTPQEKQVFQWQMEAFRYFGLSDEVYIQCDVIICTNTSVNPACRRCGESVNPARKRRDLSTGAVDPSMDSKIISVRSGKLILADDIVTAARVDAVDSQSVFAGTKGTVIIVLLAVIVFIAVIAVIKNLFFSPATLTKSSEECM